MSHILVLMTRVFRAIKHKTDPNNVFIVTQTMPTIKNNTFPPLLPSDVLYALGYDRRQASFAPDVENIFSACKLCVFTTLALFVTVAVIRVWNFHSFRTCHYSKLVCFCLIRMRCIGYLYHRINSFLFCKRIIMAVTEKRTKEGLLYRFAKHCSTKSSS